MSSVSTVDVKVDVVSNQGSYLLEQQDISIVVLFAFASSDLSTQVLDDCARALLSESIDEFGHILTVIQAHDDSHVLLIVEKRQLSHPLLKAKIDRFLGETQDCSFRSSIVLMKISRL
tara:strand:+ start:740 stop:1093 length:354 start_codon:yes stop_codon:yes gene_type:complete